VPIIFSGAEPEEGGVTISGNQTGRLLSGNPLHSRQFVALAAIRQWQSVALAAIRQWPSVALAAIRQWQSVALAAIRQWQSVALAAIRCLRVHLELNDWVLEVRALQRPPLTQPKCTVEIPFVREQVAVLQYLMRECNQAT